MWTSSESSEFTESLRGCRMQNPSRPDVCGKTIAVKHRLRYFGGKIGEKGERMMKSINEAEIDNTCRERWYLAESYPYFWAISELSQSDSRAVGLQTADFPYQSLEFYFPVQLQCDITQTVQYWQLTVVVILVSWCWFSSLCAVYPLLLIECVFNVISRLIRVSSFGILTPSSHPLQSEGDLSFDGELFVTQEVSSAPLIQTTAVTGATPRSQLLQADPVLNLPGPSGDAGAVADVPPANVAVQPAAPPDVGFWHTVPYSPFAGNPPPLI
ncbi:uncharacterized protein V6R79_002749 [Siganus canaliculatus]